MKKLFLFVALILIGLHGIGQTAAQYAFSQNIGTYTPIVGGTTITPTGVTYFDDNSYGPLNIGFNFTWRGTVYTQFGLNENGFVSLGATVPSSSYTSLSTGTSNDVISAFNYDLYGLVANGAEIRYQTLGSAPNRSLVVQFKSYGFYTAPQGLADFNFQFQLYETSNVVKIVYGPYAGTSASLTLQVGLRGASAADFNNRTTTTNWSATTAGGTNTATCSYTPPGVMPASGLTFTWTPPAPCATPAAQPTSLILTPSTTTIAGSFTASASADTYLVIRSLSSTLGATPVNGTVYTVGNTFGSGIVDSWVGGTTFTSTGLTPNTQYYYYIFAANNSCVGSPPLYLTTSPLIGNQTTLAIFPISGNKTVGPTGDFFTLTAAFAYLNANGVNGALNLILQSTYVSSVEPAFPIPALFVPGASAVNTVTVYPSAGGLSITSGSATGTINLTGASYITFDGRVNATGAVKSLVIENSGGGYTVQYVNGATYDGLKYCIIKGSNTTGATSTIFFGSTTTSVGNSYETIDNCEIRDGVATPGYAILSAGSASPILFNSNCTISNCYIHDFYFSAGGNPVGIFINNGTTAWTITGNSFYQVATLNPTAAVGFNVILIAAGDGYTINNNYIGGSAPNCGGTPWTLNGNGTPPTIANFIYAIRITTGALTVNPSAIEGNTIANINMSTNPTAPSIYFVGMLCVAGIQNIGDVTPNVIGAATGTGSITITVGNGAFATTYEGIDFRGMYGNINNNICGSWTIGGVTGSASASIITIRPISVTPTVQNGPGSVSGNLVGSLTTANSIQTPALPFPPVQIQGFFISSTGAGTMNILNNTIANITNLSAHVSAHICALYHSGAAVPGIISGTTIHDLTTTSINTTLTLASVVGIYALNTAPGEVIRGSNIYNLTNTTAAAAVGVNGIYIATAAGSMLCEKNFIHNLSLTSNTTATAQLTGITMNSSGTYGKFRNNMIQLGINPDGSASTADCIVYGFNEAGATIDSVLFNSIYIGGAPAAGTTGSSYAFYSSIAPSLSTPRVYLNNIFFNARSGGSTGEHYGIRVGGATQFPLGLTSNYNMILANGAVGGVFGSFNALDQTTFAAWKNTVGTDIASGNANPNFIAPTGNAATANLHVVSPTPIEAAGIALSGVTDDFDSQIRSGLTPTDIGADAANFTLSADVNGPNITYIPIGNGVVAGTRVLTNWATITDNVGVSTGASLPRIYYKKSTDANAFVGNTSGNNGWKYVVASNSSTPFSFTINYALLQAPVAAGDIIQYFVVAQDNANNLSSWYPLAGFSATPPVQNINASPTNFQSYTIVSGSIPTTINVPGTYATLTATGGAFDAINQGVLVGNTTINITADLIEPGTVGLNAWAEDVPGANYKLVIQPDASALRTISGTATLAGGTGLIRTNGASRFTINGKAGKYLTFRFTNVAPASNQPTIQFNNGSVNDTLKNCTIESNSSSATYGSVNIGYLSTAANVVVIMNNDIRDATAGTTGLQAAGIVSSSILNSVIILNNNIYNFNAYGFYTSGGVADGAVISGNSFYYNSALANTTTQYCIYFSSGLNNHTISGNFFGGQAPACGGAAWNATTTNSLEGIYATFGVITPTNISNNTFQNVNLSNVGSAYCYPIYIYGGVVNILNNLVGSTTITSSITCAGTGYMYAIYASVSSAAASNIQGNTVCGLNYTNLAGGYIYCYDFPGGLVKVGTTSPNVAGSNTLAGAITYAGSGGIYGIYCTSSNPGNAIENNIIGNITYTRTTAGSPYFYGMYVYSANVKKNRIISIGCSNAITTPYMYGIFNYGVSGVTNEYSNNLISLDGGLATNPYIYGFYDGSYSTSFYNLYFNDFYVSGPATTTSSTYAFYRGVAAFYTLRDNIIANKRVAGGTGKHYAAYISSTGVWSSNYNDLYSLAGPLGYYSADQATLASWQTATGGDYNSQNVDPLFVSSTDLHTAVPALNNSGVTIAGITTDYSGAIRTSPPDIGAYEFSLSPVVVTVPASSITAVSATLNGTVNSGNEITVTGFDYGLNISYGTSIAGSPASITSIAATPFTGPIAGLTPNTLYHFRAKGTANAITYYGNDLTFTTLAIPPTVVTTAATTITSTTVTLNGTVNANNASTTVSFDYGLTVAYGTNVPGVPLTVNGVVATGVLANLTGLLPCTLYHYRVNGVNAGGTANGNDLTFTTAPGAPAAVTTAATGIGTTTATLNGTVTANCAATAVTFDYGLTVAYGTTVPGAPTGFSGNSATAVSAAITGLTVNTTYHYRVCGSNANGSNCGNDMTFLTGCPIAGPAGPITGPTQVCQGQCGYVYSVTIPNATGYVWTLPVGGSITSGANTNTISVCYAANAVSGYVFVYGTAACGNGSPSQLAVAVNPPAAPTITGPAAVCVNSCGNVYSTQSGMSAYVWTVSAGGTITAGAGTSAITVCWNTAGAKTVSVNYNTAFGCPALSPTVYNVTVNPLPVPTIAGPSPACANFPGLIYSTQAGMTGYTWAISAGGSITSGVGTNSVTVTWVATGAQTISVNYTNANGCTAAAPVVYPVTVNSGASPTITGTTTLCINSGYYNYTTESGMSLYNWTISPGGVINFGSGTNVITVSWTVAGAQWVRVNYTTPGGCQAPAPTQLNITVNAPPAGAGSITGTSTVCGGASGVAYSVAAVSGATAYVWTLPAGATIASGSGTNSITVNFAGNASSGNITVYANNLCGNGATSPPFAVTVNPLPGDAGTITGPASVCEGETGVVYTVSPISGATGYMWTVPTGATIMSGGNTNSIVVDFSLAAVSGNITALGTNSCGNGNVSPNFAVTVNAVPAAPVVTNTHTTLYSSAPTGNQWYYSATQTGTGAPIAGATGQTYDATLDGWYWSVVTLNGCSSVESNRVQILTTGIGSHSSSAINIYPVPNDGQFNVSISTVSSESFTISVYNYLGVRIYQETKVDVNGSLTKVIDLRPVPSGVYSVIFEDSLGQVVKKIVVNK
jgi:hypothetical protein